MAVMEHGVLIVLGLLGISLSYYHAKDALFRRVSSSWYAAGFKAAMDDAMIES